MIRLRGEFGFPRRSRYLAGHETAESSHSTALGVYALRKKAERIGMVEAQRREARD
jgi:hypothetical protein